mmetsp:Transcript_54224/g.172112  ORF Transcript_54224/g.172112 Transcript_54224/m.172112 type:complete len:200 (-) Transcript_54224:1765-2364(-)
MIASTRAVPTMRSNSSGSSKVAASAGSKSSPRELYITRSSSTSSPLARRRKASRSSSSPTATLATPRPSSFTPSPNDERRGLLLPLPPSQQDSDTRGDVPHGPLKSGSGTTWARWRAAPSLVGGWVWKGGKPPRSPVGTRAAGDPGRRRKEGEDKASVAGATCGDPSRLGAGAVASDATGINTRFDELISTAGGGAGGG